ncbi:hypothetical protein Ahy_B04g072968 [Arachis hypogaea]|uniref:Uncharacterized protein n=1 Tax=Arachis hypogaea TaxID=3818 RepID=A0A444ZP81_ARAHY|nr:hypothetical protein Ahy_B04g072968 [Arachis hypogaea]
MEQKKSSIVLVFREFKPHFLMVLVQVGYAFLYFITEASFNHGMSPFLYVTYRHIVAGVVMFPFAFFLERNERPMLGSWKFLCFPWLGKISVPINMNFASLQYTSPTFVASIVNVIASLTFIIAVVLSLSISVSVPQNRRYLNVPNPRGIAKVIGTMLSLGGAMTMTLYKGPTMRNLWRPLIHIPGKSAAATHENWLKGSLLAVIGCVSWYIMQVKTCMIYQTDHKTQPITARREPLSHETQPITARREPLSQFSYAAPALFPRILITGPHKFFMVRPLYSVIVITPPKDNIVPITFAIPGDLERQEPHT